MKRNDFSSFTAGPDALLARATAPPRLWLKKIGETAGHAVLPPVGAMLPAVDVAILLDPFTVELPLREAAPPEVSVAPTAPPTEVAPPTAPPPERGDDASAQLTPLPPQPQRQRARVVAVPSPVRQARSGVVVPIYRRRPAPPSDRQVTLTDGEAGRSLQAAVDKVEDRLAAWSQSGDPATGRRWTPRAGGRSRGRAILPTSPSAPSKPQRHRPTTASVPRPGTNKRAQWPPGESRRQAFASIQKAAERAESSAADRAESSRALPRRHESQAGARQVATPPAGSEGSRHLVRITELVEQAVEDLASVDQKLSGFVPNSPPGSPGETAPQPVEWLEDDQLADRLQSIFARQARQRGIDLS